MGDKYNIQNTQAGAIGDNATAQNITFNNTDNTPSDALQAELLAILHHLSTLQNDPDLEKKKETIRSAMDSAGRQQKDKTIAILKGAGKWIFDVAKAIGARLVSELILHR